MIQRIFMLVLELFLSLCGLYDRHVTNGILKIFKNSLIPFFKKVSTMILSCFMKKNVNEIKSSAKTNEENDFAILSRTAPSQLN